MWMRTVGRPDTRVGGGTAKKVWREGNTKVKGVKRMKKTETKLRRRGDTHVSLTLWTYKKEKGEDCRKGCKRGLERVWWERGKNRIQKRKDGTQSRFSCRQITTLSLVSLCCSCCTHFCICKSVSDLISLQLSISHSSLHLHGRASRGWGMGINWNLKSA